ncbi:MAG: short-chain oxidoreductase [Gammaproteobacteria bacterium]|nr:short-chain oxidoreductase [Gammaproteobacteria bacterium]MBU1556284.1 short-chain oxidoreductase [Gammaproteobacteria bacterium]MBU2070467.1 short-chain oxidoreductase [Gammaproteobacteria bacterium]MBU2185268.1 short-chain oxidoreductase [Gammaproteobacteria bacterium]MBU2205059.1 short-chain oxidoreductase [Gammaproteobacteria bacterium]
MAFQARQVADNASFQAFVNAYLREIQPGVWHSGCQWQRCCGLEIDPQSQYVIELQLANTEQRLAIGAAYRSLVGRHRLTACYQLQTGSLDWQPLDSISAIMLLIREIYAQPGRRTTISEQQLELTARTLESHQIMTQYLQARFDDPQLHSTRFIDTEQSILFGHWLHPTPKSRQGMHRWQHVHYAPELKGRFKLHFFAATAELVIQNSVLAQSAEQIVADIARREPDAALRQQAEQRCQQGMVLLAVHPLQAQWLVTQQNIQQLLGTEQLIDIGPLGPRFTATSSVRTLYCDELNYMVKVSIPVKITNSLRINMHYELEAGVTLARLLAANGFSQRQPEFRLISDPAYLSLALLQQQESGFEFIIRDNPFYQQSADTGLAGVQSLAALLQEPVLPAQPSRLAKIIMQLSQQQGTSLQQTSLDWFNRYWQCAIAPAIQLFDQLGIALEAHQQNSILELSNGYPGAYYYRDNQGFYLAESQRDNLLQLEPGLQQCAKLFYPDAVIFDRFSYYLLINQLFAVINRFGLDGLLSEAVLVQEARNRLFSLLPRMSERGRALIESMLYRQTIPCKGNLLTRVEDVDELQAENELAVYTRISNPLYTASKLSGPTSSDESSAEVARELA